MLPSAVSICEPGSGCGTYGLVLHTTLPAWHVAEEVELQFHAFEEKQALSVTAEVDLKVDVQPLVLQLC